MDQNHHYGVKQIQVEEIVNQIQGLSLEQRLELTRQLISKNASDIRNDSFFIHVNKSVDEISSQLKGLPKIVWQKLLQAVAICIMPDN
ncbi:hypothetical protein NG796_16870 [Laspinema sp. A4]|uniref:hypothetical protein n=1 Tax=Laspinema sp. D2d TaxID=2953686 RepID=UPI0021BB1473|nr:hypothetical protein [Laspinema sp. D2d]MCT7984946.1 hypothetical protein [Laspinema sp. D2d]